MPAAAVYSILLKKENAHSDPIYCCAWGRANTTGDSNGPKKDFIVTAGLDCLIKVWTLENNKLECLNTLHGHSMAVVSLAISPDGHTLASTSLDCTLIIWDLIAGNMVHDIITGPTDVWDVAFSPKGDQVVTGSHTGKLFVYGVEKGTTDCVLDTRGKFALSVAWSPDARYIASGATDGAACIFDVAQGKLVHTVEAHSKPVRAITFAPNSLYFVTASDDGNVKVYDVGSASLQSTLELKNWALAVSMCSDGTCVATGSADGAVRVALAEGLKLHHSFQEHTDAVWGVQFNSEGNKLLSVSKDKSIIVYECPLLPKNKAPAKK